MSPPLSLASTVIRLFHEVKILEKDEITEMHRIIKEYAQNVRIEDSVREVKKIEKDIRKGYSAVKKDDWEKVYNLAADMTECLSHAISHVRRLLE